MGSSESRGLAEHCGRVGTLTVARGYPAGYRATRRFGDGLDRAAGFRDRLEAAGLARLRRRGVVLPADARLAALRAVAARREARLA